MPRNLLFLILVLGLVFVVPSAVLAQDDDDASDDDATGDDDADEGFFASSVMFTEPAALEPNAELFFQISVTNAAVADTGKGDWINQVDLTMPSQDYVVDEAILTAPDPLHGATGDDTEIDKWVVSFDPTTVTITWAVMAAVSSANYGDIREGDTLAFEFTATTDADATDGFDWVLYSDEGNIVTGTAYVEDQDDDDDDDDDDDNNDDNDDDDDGGCGC